MEQPENMYFHESTVLALFRDETSIRLGLEGILVDDAEMSATIDFRNVRQLLIDGIPSREIGMEFPDGEILTLAHTDDVAELLIEWNDFKNRCAITKSYRIDCDAVEFQQN